MAEGFFRPDQLQIPGLAPDVMCAAMVRILPRTLLGMVRHEFAKAVEAGAAFRATVPLDGGGTGFAIDTSCHVLTNHHLVASEVANHGRATGAI